MVACLSGKTLISVIDDTASAVQEQGHRIQRAELTALPEPPLMNQSSFRLFNHSARLLLAALSCLPFGGACSSDEAAPTTPTTFGVEITTLDGMSASEPIALRCDQGGPTDASLEAGVGGASEAVPGAFSTLVVAVSLTPTELATKFVLRPAHACGTSARCGYIRYGYVKAEIVSDPGRILRDAESALCIPHDPERLRDWWPIFNESTSSEAGWRRWLRRLRRFDHRQE